MESLYEPPREVNAVAFSPDGRLLASQEGTADLYVWDAETGELVFGVTANSNMGLRPGQVKFSPDGRFVAAQAGSVFVFDVATEELVQVFHRGNTEWSPDECPGVSCQNAWGFDFSPEGDRFVVASEDGQATVWDSESGEMQLVLLTEGNWQVSYVAFSPDGELIATITAYGPVRLWSAASGEELVLIGDEVLRGPLAFSPDSQELAIGQGDTGIVSIWDVQDRTKTKEIEVNTGGESIWVNSVMYDATGDVLLASTSDGLVVIRDLVTDKDLLRLDLEFLLEQAAISPDGSRFATAGADGSLLIWDTATGEVILAMEQPAAD
jgi:WD40 repeat protein